MKYMFFVTLTFFTSIIYAGGDFSGIWKDNQGIFYSIHQSNDSIVVAELQDNQAVVSPAEQGAIYFTNNELDLAISGYGFFILESETGTYSYTRNGKFHLSPDNKIVNDRGERLVTKNRLNIPNTTAGMVINSKDDTAKPSGCATVFGCATAIKETRSIIIAADGTISLHNLESGEIFSFDRILLAWIPPRKIKFTGYPINLLEQNSVSNFYAGDISQQSIYHKASIQQGSLEKLSYDMKVWRGYYGAFNGNKSINLILESSDGDASTKEIYFYSDTTATIKFKCISDVKICNAIDGLNDKDLIKIY